MSGINEGITCNIYKFVHDTKIMGRVTTTAEKIWLQSNLDSLFSWSEKWQIELNFDKWKVLYIRNNNHYTKFTMYSSELSKSSYEKTWR